MAGKQCFIPTCDSNVTPIAASTNVPFTSRSSIDPTGLLSSVYNADTDHVLSRAEFGFGKVSISSHRRPDCYIQRTCMSDKHNALKLCNIHSELRLSLLTEIIEANSIGALVHYTHPLNKYTRLILFKYYSATDFLSNSTLSAQKQMKLKNPSIPGTHIITLVNWGIEAISVLQLPHDEINASAIDYVLQKICNMLTNPQPSLTLTNEDKVILDRIVRTQVFSNIKHLTHLTSIVDFQREILSLIKQPQLHKPCNYNLCPIDSIFAPTCNRKPVIYTELKRELVDSIESYLFPLSIQYKRLNSKLIDEQHPLVEKYFKARIDDVRERWRHFKLSYMHEIERIRNVVLGIRRCEIDQDKIRNSIENREVKTTMEELTSKADALLKKEELIKDLLAKGFTYKPAIDLNITNNDSEEVMKQKVVNGLMHTRVMCCDDELQRDKLTKWTRMINECIGERGRKNELQLMYIDFSYCSYKLNDIVVYSSLDSDRNEEQSTDPPSALFDGKKTDEILNILLLGETGVGKSTFINAFANYLKFNEFCEAEKNPIILMPVSFFMTIDDQFPGKSVRFECDNNSDTENHKDAGRSVTEHCRSYIFNFNDENRINRRLRIIDTPGFGDTRGLSQDKRNLQHILLYISNLTHLNAVCILLKPNITQLNTLFCLSIVQLVDMLGRNSTAKILFCFTNSRSTFYKPGDTAPTLRKFLELIPEKKIAFTKENTFCFDSESFRYLVAKCNKINFGKNEQQEYNHSWTISSREAKRLFKFIRINMSSAIIPNQLHSMKHAQLKIQMMIRPMLESIRNILRNIILLHENASAVTIELCPQAINHPAAICFGCSRNYAQVSGFWIMKDVLHHFHNECRTCQCNVSDHFSIDYKLEYRQRNDSEEVCENDLKMMIDDLCQTCAEFAHFLLTSSNDDENDLFLLGFDRLITEEGKICMEMTPKSLNEKLKEQLEQLTRRYETNKQTLFNNKNSIMQLDNIYRTMENLHKNHWIDMQMSAIVKWHRHMLKDFEHKLFS